jgi:hypothetical protein
MPLTKTTIRLTPRQLAQLREAVGTDHSFALVSQPWVADDLHCGNPGTMDIYICTAAQYQALLPTWEKLRQLPGFEKE